MYTNSATVCVRPQTKMNEIGREKEIQKKNNNSFSTSNN